MKTIKNMLYIATMATAITACSSEEVLSPEADAPLTITATIPGDVWAVATRANEGAAAESFSDWTLHYIDYRGEAATYTPTTVAEGASGISFTTGNELVWAKVKVSEPMHLTARCDNATPAVSDDDYTLHTSVASATAGEELTFPDMKPTLAKLTVNLTLSHNMTNNSTAATDFTVTINAKKQAISYAPITHGGVWPAADGDAATTAFTLSQQSAATGTYTVIGTMLLPQQDLGNTLTVKYKETTWTLDLSTVAVTGGEEGQKANRLIAGQHLTLNLSTSILSVGAPSDIQIDAFTTADPNSYTPDLGGVAKTWKSITLK